MTALPAAGGVLPVDKPEGPTSHDVVAGVRRVMGTRRVGHTGTLDPFASGLLLLCLGPATRLSPYLTGLDKTYRATARFGVATDTLDREGAVGATDDAWTGFAGEEVAAALQALVGTHPQVPPAFSAKKVGGEAAHRKARRGESVVLEAVPVTVHTAEMEAWDPPEVRFRVACSSGTYIRSLARDLGAALGTGAHLTALRREAVGPFRVADALSLEGMEPGAALEVLIPPARALAHLPRVSVGAEDARRLTMGQRIDLPGGVVPAGAEPPDADGEGGGEPAPVVVLLDGELLAIARVEGDQLQPRKVFGGLP